MAVQCVLWLYSAYCGCNREGADKDTPAECAIKVFKTTLADFRNRSIYMKGDTRFFKDEFKKQNPRKIMKLWAEKEEINLRRYTPVVTATAMAWYELLQVLKLN